MALIVDRVAGPTSCKICDNRDACKNQDMLLWVKHALKDTPFHVTCDGYEFHIDLGLKKKEEV